MGGAVTVQTCLGRDPPPSQRHNIRGERERARDGDGGL